MATSKHRDAEQTAARDPRRPARRERQPPRAIEAQRRPRPRRPEAAGLIGRECDPHYAYLTEAHD